ncbi:MAG: SRPBCC family protein [Actinomycetota bacterium]|nr:SRPBCC family protein [Actinomycetota bacterium]
MCGRSSRTQAPTLLGDPRSWSFDRYQTLRSRSDRTFERRSGGAVARSRSTTSLPLWSRRRRLGMRGGWKAADFELDLLLEPRDGGTLASFDWSFRPKTLLMRLATPLLGRTLRGATKDELAGLKSYVESKPR